MHCPTTSPHSPPIFLHSSSTQLDDLSSVPTNVRHPEAFSSSPNQSLLLTFYYPSLSFFRRRILHRAAVPGVPNFDTTPDSCSPPLPTSSVDAPVAVENPFRSLEILFRSINPRFSPAFQLKLYRTATSQVADPVDRSLPPSLCHLTALSIPRRL